MGRILIRNGKKTKIGDCSNWSNVINHGIIWTIALGVAEKYIYGFLVTGLFVIVGVILIALALGD